MYSMQEAHEAGWKGEEAERFVAWMNALDAECVKRTGFGMDELVGDWYYADNFTSGASPENACTDLLEYAAEDGFPIDMLDL